MPQSFADELRTIAKSHNLAVSLERAFDYARDGEQPAVTLEHLLLALSEDAEAAAVLNTCNVDLDRLRTDVAAFLGRLERHPDAGAPLADPSLLTIVRHAAAAAQKSGRSQLNGAIVLAAIIGDGKSNAAQILEGQGLTFQGTLQALQSLGSNPAQQQPQPGPVSGHGSAPAPSSETEPVQPEHRPASTIAPASIAKPAEMVEQTPGDTARPSPVQPSQDEPTSDRTTTGSAPCEPNEPSVDDILATVRDRVKTRTNGNTDDVTSPSAAPPASTPQADDVKTAPPAEAVQQTASPAPADSAPTAAPPAHDPAAGSSPPSGQPAAPAQPFPNVVGRPAAPVSPELATEVTAPPQQVFPGPSVPSDLTDKWSRAIDGKPARPASRIPSANQGAGIQDSPLTPSPAAPIPQDPQGDASSDFGQTGRPAGTVPAEEAGNAPVSPAAPQTGPVSSSAPDSTSIDRTSTGNAPIAPWPEPLDPHKQPPPSAAPVPPPGMGVNVNPAGAPYPAPDEALIPAQARNSSPGQQPPGAPSQQQTRAHGRSPGAPTRTGASAQGAPTRRKNDQPAIQLGQLVENIPRVMRVDIPRTIEVRIARDKIDGLGDGMSGTAPVQRHDLFVTRAMTVKLKAPDGGFWIETASPETQWIENALGLLHDEYASWRWTVTPKARGPKRLQLVISARTVGSDGLAAETPLPDQVFTVKVRINYKRTLKKFGGWVIAALVGGAVSTFGGSLVGTDGLKRLLELVGL